MQLPGMRMLDAYRLAHYEDALRRLPAPWSRAWWSASASAGAPAENGTHPGSAAVTGADVAGMTRAQREALERRALHGAKIEL